MIGRRGRQAQINKARDPYCRQCGLRQYSQNICIMGRGNPMAPIVAIGEAPGQAEAETGKPFMGRAGHLLNEILDELNLTNLVYITNVVRCRPPENRTPFSSESRICSQYLHKELSIILPRVIVVMGRTAQSGMGFSKRKRGKPFIQPTQWGPHWVQLTYHPAFPLYPGNSEARKTIKRHFAWVRDFIKGATDENLHHSA